MQPCPKVQLRKSRANHATIARHHKPSLCSLSVENKLWEVSSPFSRFHTSFGAVFVWGLVTLSPVPLSEPLEGSQTGLSALPENSAKKFRKEYSILDLLDTKLHIPVFFFDRHSSICQCLCLISTSFVMQLSQMKLL